MLHGVTKTEYVQWYFLRVGERCNRNYFEYPDGSGGSYEPCDHITEYTRDERAHWFLSDNKYQFGYGNFFDPKTNQWLTKDEIIEEF